MAKISEVFGGAAAIVKGMGITFGEMLNPNGSLYVTDSPQPYPVLLVGTYDTVAFADFNAPGGIAVPTSVQHIPST